MTEKTRDPLFGAAVLKLSFIMKGLADEPGFRIVYFGALNDLGITNTEVDEYIKEHRQELETHIRSTGKTE
jgi:hypothetical protein